MGAIEDLGIKNVRIDERLIHGQVATMWTNQLRATRIMVVDDAVVKDDITKMALKTAVPSGTHLSILTAAGAARRILAGQYKDQRVFLIVKKPATLRQLVDLDVPLTLVNVGNMSTKKDTQQVRQSVAVSAQDIEDFKYVTAKGVKFIAQMVPSANAEDFMKFLP